MKQHMHSHATYKHVAETHYRDDNYCSVVALAAAARIGYGKAFHAMRRAGRERGRGAMFGQIQEAYANFGIRLNHTTECSEFQHLTLSQFARRARQEATYLILVRGHIVCVRNGEFIDWTTAGSRHRVKFCWRVS